jgi:hypothetical protein
MGSLAESLNPNTRYYHFDCRAYDAIRAAVNILTVNYLRILADVKARVNAVCPSPVIINLSGLSDSIPGG